jgi:hypothetical protein
MYVALVVSIVQCHTCWCARSDVERLDQAPPVILLRLAHGEYELSPPMSFFTLFQARIAEGFRLHSITSNHGM